jgi:glycosyltransferase involved in cell wall biosynthesis
VVIATYNWSTVLPYSIGSVLRQTFTDLELLVIGDGCTDDSPAVVARCDDPRVRWINLPVNTGHQWGPNNTALREGKGELVAYLGHDDLWLPHHLAVLVAAIDAGADLACGLTEMVPPDGRAAEFVPITDAPFQGRSWLPPSGLIHRRRLALDVGGWRSPLEVPIDPEIDLVRRMLVAGGRSAFVSRLTAVKFSASRRKDAYRLRGCAEQARWFERIGREPDFEQRELVAMLVGVERAVRVLIPQRIRSWLRRSADALFRRALGTRASRWRTRRHVDRRRRFRGLSPLR